MEPERLLREKREEILRIWAEYEARNVRGSRRGPG